MKLTPFVKKQANVGRGRFSTELESIWTGAYNLCLYRAHTSEQQARRFANATVRGVRQADRCLARSN